MFVQVWLPFFVALAQGYSTFTTTCKTPEDTVNFVSSPNARGSLDILWSCLFTILACTWNILYLNFREQRDGRDHGWRGDFKRAWKDFWPSLQWMAITIFAPEVLLAKNMADLKDARIDEAALREFADNDGVPWTLAHSMYANMGGFVVRGFEARYLASTQNEERSRNPQIEDGGQDIARAEKQVSSDPELAIDISTNRVSMESRGATGECPLGHSPLASSSYVDHQPLPNKTTTDSRLDKTTSLSDLSSQDPPGERRIIYLIGPDILKLRQRGILAKLPFITIEEIKDKSKTDGFSRAVAIFQILWMAVQTIARKARGIPISPLEIAVMAFAACAIIIYSFNADKPKGVGAPITLLRYEGEIPQRDRDVLRRLYDQLENHVSGLTELIAFFKRILFGKSSERRLDHPVPNSFSRGGRGIAQDVTGNFEGIIFGGVVFGAIHVTAWNFSFPTRTELILWRVASVWCTVSVLVFFFIYSIPFFSQRHQRLGKLVVAVSMPLTVIIVVLYVLARLFLIVEIFRTLCYLPPEAYVTTWASNVLHAG